MSDADLNDDSENLPGSRLWLLVAVVCLVFVLLAVLSGNWVRYQALKEQYQAERQQLRLYALQLQGELARFESVPPLLVTNQRVAKVLTQPENFSARQALNEYFEHSADSIGALDIYLMDHTGLTLAASNWQSDSTFIGRNFAFRPYFQQAIKGGNGRYFALGSTSLVRGYYFSSPVYHLGQVVGVVVLKMDVSQIELGWQGVTSPLMVTDPDGVVFISTNPSWRYRLLPRSSPLSIERLAESGRYPGIEHKQLPLRSWQDFEEAELARITSADKESRYMHLRQQMPAMDWTLHLLSPLDDVHRQVLNALLGVFSAFVVLGLLFAIWWQRRQQRVERLRCDTQARLALEKAHEQLEQRVQERTIDLRHEVEERRRAEEALRAAQDELVQAAKLAMLGQMSASITHELNQPLTAIRTYADNAGLLLERGRTEDVHSNLQQIRELIDRMAQISSQLKLFARKSSGQKTPVLLSNELDVSLKILDSEIRKGGVIVDRDLEDESVKVLADSTRLEQVLVNLIGNAVHALEGVEQPVVHIFSQAHGQRLSISIEDNGSGIAEENLEQIFDPFFTTRQSGLGLGLAISQRIIENTGGQLTAANNPYGGAIFTITLDQAPVDD